MGGDMFLDKHHTCDCGHHCCGECLITHVRKAHPSYYMNELLPILKRERGNEWMLVHYPVPYNVVNISDYRAKNEPRQEA